MVIELGIEWSAIWSEIIHDFKIERARNASLI